MIFQRGEYTKPMGFGGWFFKGGSTQNRWVLMNDFSKGGVHKTDDLWWVIFQRGGGTQNRWVLMGFEINFFLLLKLSARGVYFGKYGTYFVWHITLQGKGVMETFWLTPSPTLVCYPSPVVNDFSYMRRTTIRRGRLSEDTIMEDA